MKDKKLKLGSGSPRRTKVDGGWDRVWREGSIGRLKAEGEGNHIRIREG